MRCTAPSISIATAGPAPTSVRWFCSNPLGTDATDRFLFGTCESATESDRGDYACTGPLGTDETGRARFTDCELVATLGPLAIDRPGALPYDPLRAEDVRAEAYVVGARDTMASIEAATCVSGDAIARVNGWFDANAIRLDVGTRLAIPIGYDERVCELRSYTITVDDTTRIGVARRFCVEVNALDQANEDTPRYSVFPPGLEIVIPPSVEEC
ncbi:MAG: hypothetical protein AB8G14_02065 [Ilumatobacter sp.]